MLKHLGIFTLAVMLGGCAVQNPPPPGPNDPANPNAAEAPLPDSSNALTPPEVVLPTTEKANDENRVPHAGHDMSHMKMGGNDGR